MASVFIKALWLLLVADLYSCVVVNDGDFSFPLNDVKKLQKMMSVNVMDDSPQRAVEAEYSLVCANNDLPEVFKPVCLSPDSRNVFKRMAQIPTDICEICAHAACGGC
ncbi:guanylin [Microcaecilia unicolor]|uniref:Guanylate cyclase activator 2B n=1 Tax=Microcaecilia unicolor TaxID=1415580 RepID=A0A6P7WUE3_9AMPH|nr:guanylin-like [Microcaecilia unicolor]